MRMTVFKPAYYRPKQYALSSRPPVDSYKYKYYIIQQWAMSGVIYSLIRLYCNSAKSSFLRSNTCLPFHWDKDSGFPENVHKIGERSIRFILSYICNAAVHFREDDVALNTNAICQLDVERARWLANPRPTHV